MDQVGNVVDETFDRDFWERRWAQALREHPPSMRAVGTGQAQVTVEDAQEGLDSREWHIVLAEQRTRPGGTGVDAVVRAVYQGGRAEPG